MNETIQSMSDRMLALMLGVLLIVFSDRAVGATYGGGSGTANDPHQIWNADQMNTVGLSEEDWDKDFKLMADINLAGFDGGPGRQKFNNIGRYITYQHPDNLPFSGVFDGNGYTISNFTYSATDEFYVGLFQDINGAEIRNLGLIDALIHASDTTGAIAGRVVNSRITDCYTRGTTVTGGVEVGGLAGFNHGGLITDCHVEDANTSAAALIGGLIGSNADGVIINCYASGIVTGAGYGVGGLVGASVGASTIANCHSVGYVKGTTSQFRAVGGLVGATSGNIINCYATGVVSGTDWDIGGLVGTARSGVISGSYWNVEEGEPNMCGSEDEDANGCDNSRGKTASEMKRQSTFTDWDFINVWAIGENQTYPYLRTHSASDINKDNITNFLDLCIVAEQWMDER